MQRVVKFMVWCLHVRHKPVFYQNGWNNHAVIRRSVCFSYEKKQADLFAVLAQNAAYLTGGKQV